MALQFYRPEKEVIVACFKVVLEEYLTHFGQVPIYGRCNKRPCENIAASSGIICQIRSWEKEGQVPVGNIMVWLVSKKGFSKTRV